MGLLGRRAHVAGLAVAVSLLGAARPTLAQPPRAAVATAEAQQKARDHYKRAQELYSAGSYHEAIGELEAAHELDPLATQLVFNLGVVNEKLGNIDQALGHFRRYLEMDIEPQERARAESLVKRLEGAKREVKADVPSPQATPQPSPRGPEPRDGPPPHGRIDVLTLTAAAVAVGGVAVGAVFGLKALGDKPTFNARYASFAEYNANYAATQSQLEKARNEAKVADVSFIVAGAATVATAVLFFARRREVRQSSVEISAAPLVGGGSGVGAVGTVGGRF